MSHTVLSSAEDLSVFDGFDQRCVSLWWILNHSTDPKRRIAVVTGYIDESGTDTKSPIAVIGGVLLEMDDFFWLDTDWRKTLHKHKIAWPLHMMDFGQHGKYGHLSSEDRRALFADIARDINAHKRISFASYLSSANYRKHFDGVTKLSMYGASLIQVLAINGSLAQSVKYTDRISYVLDDGNPYKHQAQDAFDFVKSSEDLKKAYDLNLGAFGFDSDSNICALQAGDVVSWSVRRKHDQGLKSGFEPLEVLFNPFHLEIEYNDYWMKAVADVAKRGDNR